MEKQVSEGSLHKWFKGSKSKDGKGGWVNVVTGGTCASDEPGEGTPKCVSSAKRASMTKAERLSAARRKKKADPGQQQKSGAAKPTYVSTDSPRKKKKKKKMNEGWSDKYKQSIDCDNPKGFSQKAHCQGKKKMKETYERSLTPLSEKAKKCWPGYEKKGTKKMFGKTYNNCVKKEEVELSERLGGKGVSKKAAQSSMYPGNKGDGDYEDSDRGAGNKAARRSGKEVEKKSPTYLAHTKNKKKVDEELVVSEAKDKKGKGSGTKDACYHKVKSRYSVWPSAYASGALVKCRKVGAANWGNSSKKEDFSDWKSEFIWEDGDSSKKLDENILKRLRGKRDIDPYIDLDIKPPKPLPPGKQFYDPEDNFRSSKPARPATGLKPLEQVKPLENLPSKPSKPDKPSIPPKQDKPIEVKPDRVKPVPLPSPKRPDNNIKPVPLPSPKRPDNNIKPVPLPSPKPGSFRPSIEKNPNIKPIGRTPVEKQPNIKPIGRAPVGGTERKPMPYRPGDKPRLGTPLPKIIRPGDKPILGTPLPKIIRPGDKPAKRVPYSDHYDWRAELGEDWQKTNRQDKTDGMSQKAVNAYKRENPGSKLKTAVTKKPSSLKRGSKDAKRRKSFCSRMKGMKKRLTSAKTARDPDSRINKALRRWNC